MDGHPFLWIGMWIFCTNSCPAWANCCKVICSVINSGKHCCSTQGDLFFCFMNRIVICLIVLCGIALVFHTEQSGRSQFYSGNKRTDHIVWNSIAIPHRTISQISILFIKQKNRLGCVLSAWCCLSIERQSLEGVGGVLGHSIFCLYPPYAKAYIQKFHWITHRLTYTKKAYRQKWTKMEWLIGPSGLKHVKGCSKIILCYMIALGEGMQVERLFLYWLPQRKPDRSLAKWQKILRICCSKSKLIA